MARDAPATRSGAPDAMRRSAQRALEALLEALDLARGVDDGCLPVKKGWHLPQMSSWIASAVEPR